MPRWLPALAAPLAFATLTLAQKPTDAEQAAARAQVEKGLTVEVWAAEPLLANPVSFCFDEKGRCYVAETFRLGHGVTDDRGSPSTAARTWISPDRSAAASSARYASHTTVRPSAEMLGCFAESACGSAGLFLPPDGPL